MNLRPRRLFIGFFLAMLCLGKSSAQIITIDWSNLSAVKVTATVNSPAFSYGNGPGDTPVYAGGASSFQGEDGITLVNFLTSASATAGDVGPVATSSTLKDYSGASIFDHFYVLDNITQGGSLKDLDLYASNTSGHFIFANGEEAFTGEATFDLSAATYSDLVSLLPGLGTSGNIVMWNEFSYPLGTWTVTGAAAIPEPSTYAALAGVAALGFVALRRRRAA